MATIFEKLPASGEKCLILDSREALFYPFDFGTGWTQIRLGTIHSYTNLTDNGLFTNESITANSSANNFYYGFVYSPNNTLPFTPDTIAFVRASNTGAGITVSLVSNSALNMVASSAVGERYFASGRQLRGSTAATAVLLVGSTAVNATGSTAFAGSCQCSLNINRIGKTYSFTDSAAVQLPTFNPGNTSTQNLRGPMAAQTFSNTMTGFYTVDGTAAGNLLPLPDKAVIYSPFINNRLRIHNIVVERYD